MITFASHQARAGIAGASEDFEQMLGLLVRATSGEASLVFASPGDWGIDVLVGDLRGRVTVWQAKYFMRWVGRSQQRQIEGSFASALDAAARHGYTLERWVLCIPASIDGPATQWWHGWRAGQQRGTAVLIELWDKTRLRELLPRPRPQPCGATTTTPTGMMASPAPRRWSRLLTSHVSLARRHPRMMPLVSPPRCQDQESRGPA
jgi:hypothetical protein